MSFVRQHQVKYSFDITQAALTKDNDTQSKKAAELDGKAQALESEKNSIQKQLDKEKTTNTTMQVNSTCKF